MKKLLVYTLLFATLLSGCGQTVKEDNKNNENVENSTEKEDDTEVNKVEQKIVQVELNNDKITVDGSEIDERVYITNNIVYYEEGQDFRYGEGTENDAHSQEEADAHVVVNITEPGIYELSGKLDKGQIAVNLGDDAKDNKDAVVTLVLSNVDITCEVAPAIIFYNVYECGNKDAEKATKDIDTKSAGANIIISDKTVNNIKGSHVAKIYEPNSIELNEDGTEVIDAKKLHKYDGAFYSRMSMNVNGGEIGDGVLNIKADNEGLDSELHLTINGGVINIESGNDGINTNEDGISVTTINNGELTIKVTGETGEGDGIDSNGWLVINDGLVKAYACSLSGDSGIDSDMGIYINGGTVIATGNMLDRIEDGSQTHVVFNFSEKQDADTNLVLRNIDDSETELEVVNKYSNIIYSSPDLKEGIYSLWKNDKMFSGIKGEIFGIGMGGMTRPDFGGEQPPEGIKPPEDMKPPVEVQGSMGKEVPNGDIENKPEGFENRPEDLGERPDKGHGRPNGYENINPEINEEDFTVEFEITKGSNIFSNLKIAD